MDRDRRDDRYSNTYRPRSPRARSPPPRIDSYRAGRSPPRAGRIAADTYVPAGRASRPRSRSPAYRRRSRSPRGRDEGDRWRARPRSPIRRAYSPRRDDYRSETRGRSPRRDRDGYDSSYGRSPRPARDRSPPPRDRDISPARSRGMRSPPRVKRDRLDSPPPRASRYDEPRSRAHSPPRRAYSPRDSRDYRRRSPSPRRERVDPYTADTWRRRSPSPPRPTYASNDVSGRESGATSRLSSPPVHASRAAMVPDRDPLSAPRSPYREPERSYDRERERERSPPRRRDSPPTGPRDRDYSSGGVPTGPAYRNGDGNFSRAPPTGPAARNFSSPAMSPPVGPSASSTPAPAYPRSSNPVLAAPTQPRGGGGRGYGRGYSREYSGPPPPRRGSAHWGGGRGGTSYYDGPPAGPRSGSASYAPPFRGSSNSTSTTYPRTQRFRDHLSEMPKEVPGGQQAPELYDKSKIVKLEEEARKLREAIAAKEANKRQRTREWDVLERESSNATLRADLAEQQLRSLNGEGDAGSAAF